MKSSRENICTTAFWTGYYYNSYETFQLQTGWLFVKLHYASVFLYSANILVFQTNNSHTSIQLHYSKGHFS